MAAEGDLIAGRYRLDSHAGRGAMGTVWKAHDVRLNRTVAVKQLLLPAFLREDEADQANQRARREARIAALLVHPHAVAVYDVAEHRGNTCLIMEYFPARNLSEVLSTQGTLAPSAVAKIGTQIAAALSAAHKQGVVHRDVKPSNILVADDGTVKITDFGVARSLDGTSASTSGVVAGTPAYFAPEVAQGYAASFSCDVYSLGATLYTALEGTPPFGLDDNAIALLHRVASGDIRPPAESSPITPVLMALLAPFPKDRPSIQEARDSLAALSTDFPGEQPAHAPVSAAQPSSFPSVSTEFSPRDADQASGAASTAVSERSRSTSARKRVVTVTTIAAGLLAPLLVLAIWMSSATGPGNEVPEPRSGPNPQAQLAPPPPTSPAPQPSEATPVPPQPEPSQVPQPQAPQAPTGVAETGVLEHELSAYYALVPANLPEAWRRLTEHYRQEHVRDYTRFEAFWGAIRQAQPSGVTASSDGTVNASIDYFYKDGRVVEERTRYRMVFDDGLWKIDSSTVTQSRTRSGG